MLFEVKVPSPGESVAEVVIDRWLKNDGEYVEKDEPIAELQSDKAMLEVYAEVAGVLKILAQEGETVRVGQVIATIDTEAQAPAKTPQSTAPEAETSQETIEQQPITTDGKEKIASPAAQRLIEQHGLQPETIAASAKEGTVITKSDVLQALKQQTTVQPPPQAPTQAPTEPQTPQQPPLTIEGPKRTKRRERMSQLRKTLAQRLVYARNQTAMLTTFNEVDLSEVIRARKQYRERFEERYGIRLGFMSFFVRACCIALKEFPQVNAQIEGDEIIYFDYVDMGIAVSTDRGLVVPVIRNADSLSLAQIEIAIATLAKKARQNRITIEEMQGGTFTITNGGVFGSLLSTPILNPPQTAILGMHRIQERPVVRNGEIVARPMMYLALSYDHRLIDGKEAVSFLKRVVELLEDPVRMLLEI